MAEYLTYPAVDENFQFPPVVREALTSSTEFNLAQTTHITTQLDTSDSDIRKKLDYLYSSNVIPLNTIDGGTP